jgi:hypothetical protein
MKTDIDKLDDVAIVRRKDKFDPVSRVSEYEPRFFITKRWFKKWKTVKYEFKDSYSALDKFNETMKKLQNCLNIEIDLKHSNVIKNDISPSWSEYCDFVYVVQVFWRNVKV